MTPDLILATLWALSDFTVENGGTQLVPGSHRWEAGRLEEAVSLPEAVQSRIGFSMDHEGGLGFYDPSVILKAGK